jgi:transcription factor 1
MQRAQRTTIEAEMLCKSFHEVAGCSTPDMEWFSRHDALDQASALATAKRMQDNNIVMPQERTSPLFEEAVKNLGDGIVVDPMAAAPRFERRLEKARAMLQHTCEQIELEQPSDNFTPMRVLRSRSNVQRKQLETFYDLQCAFDRLTALHRSGNATAEEIDMMERKWDEQSRKLSFQDLSSYYAYKDNLHYWRQDPPMMHWDRREIEPLLANKEEFYPNVECSLLDIQPQPVHPLLRQTGPTDERSADSFELIVKSLMHTPKLPIDQALESVWPGAAEYIVPRCRSFRDIGHGGVNIQAKHAQLSPRMLNSRQWEELVEQWFQWPFRPSFYELVSRAQDDVSELDETGGAVGVETQFLSHQP